MKDSSTTPEKKGSPPPQHLVLWGYVLPVVIWLLLVAWVLSSSGTSYLDYSEFETLLAAGQIKDVTVGSGEIEAEVDPQSVGKLLSAASVKKLARHADQGNSSFLSVRVEDPQLIATLQAAHIPYRGKQENRWLGTVLMWFMPGLVMIGAWMLLMRRGAGSLGSMMEVGRSHAKVFVQQQTGIRFADVAGIDEAKEELVEVVQFLKEPERYRRLGAHIPKGVLIVGAPGTGKTLLAKAVAGEAGVPFLSISGSDFVEMFVGVGAARVRDLFAQAQGLAPCIIFVDELDAMGKARGAAPIASNEEREQTLNQLLVELDGFDTASGVIVLAATNRPEILDPALLRPGRFDRHIAIDRPDIIGREQILRIHAGKLVLGVDVDLKSLAARTPGFAGADLANVVNEAALHAARTNQNEVRMSDFEAALDRVIGGLEKRNRVMNPKEKETVAYHESGHALIAENRAGADRVNRISIIPRGIGALGFTQQQPTEDRYLLKRSELLDRLDVLLGGRAAEEMIYGDISTGAQDDLSKATDLARQMVTRYGMSRRLGQVTIQTARAGSLDGVTGAQGQECSEHLAQTIDEEVAALIAAAYQRDLQTLRQQRPMLEALARQLLRTEVVDRAHLDQLLKAAVTREVAAAEAP